MVISIGTGVEFGSALVPEVSCNSTSSRNDVALPLIFIGIFIDCCASVNELTNSSSRQIEYVYTKLSPKETAGQRTHVRSIVARRENQIRRLNLGGEADSGTVREIELATNNTGATARDFTTTGVAAPGSTGTATAIRTA
jgi:hypothetical protein